MGPLGLRPLAETAESAEGRDQAPPRARNRQQLHPPGCLCAQVVGPPNGRPRALGRGGKSPVESSTLFLGPATKRGVPVEAAASWADRWESKKSIPT